jgi:hypothetical protein
LCRKVGDYFGSPTDGDPQGSKTAEEQEEEQRRKKESKIEAAKRKTRNQRLTLVLPLVVLLVLLAPEWALRDFRGIVQEFHVEFRENCMYFQYLLCKLPGEIPMEFSSPTPYPGFIAVPRGRFARLRGYTGARDR